MERTKILPYVGNPVVKDQDDYNELIRRLNEIEPFYEVHLMPDKLVVRYTGKRTFAYPSNPTIDWVVSKFEYMQKNQI